MARQSVFGRPNLSGGSRRPRACVCNCPDVFTAVWAPGEGDNFTVQGLPARFNGKTPQGIAYANGVAIPATAVAPVAAGNVELNLADSLEGGDVVAMVLIFPGERCHVVASTQLGA